MKMSDFLCRLIMLFYGVLNCCLFGVFVTLILWELRRKRRNKVKLYLILLVSCQTMASLLTSLCYFFYPQHFNKFNKKIRTVKMFILNTLPMSEPDHLKYSFRSHMSNFSIRHSYTYIGRYIIYIIMDAILAAADHVPWLRLWIAVFQMAPAIIYFFSFSLFKYLEQLHYLLQFTFDDLVAFKKKVESQSKLSLSERRALHPSCQHVLFAHSQIHSHLYNLISNDMNRMFGIQLLCVVVSNFSLVQTNFSLFIHYLMKIQEFGDSIKFNAHLVNHCFWVLVGLSNLHRLISKCETVRSLSLQCTTEVHNILMAKHRTGLIDAIPLRLYSRQKIFQPIQFTAYGLFEFNFSLLYMFIVGVSIHIIVFMQFRLATVHV